VIKGRQRPRVDVSRGGDQARERLVPARGLLLALEVEAGRVLKVVLVLPRDVEPGVV
jgi:hypothetical protein